MFPNRRQNRIAGPGFHINIRYDDSHMARAMSATSNAHGKLTMGTNQREVFDVKEQELLVCKKGSTMYHDGYTHAFSVANGFPNTAGIADKELEEKIMEQVQFVGVATTEYKPSKAYSEQGFVAQVGGVTTLINEGEDTIRPGDKVAISVNLTTGRMLTRDKGIPREKIRFCLKKALIGNAQIAKAVLDAKCGGPGPGDQQAIKEAEKAVREANTALKKAKNAADKAAAQADLETKKATLAAAKTCRNGVEGIIAVVNKLQELNQRVIGKAASFARKGDRLEVILQPRNPY